MGKNVFYSEEKIYLMCLPTMIDETFGNNKTSKINADHPHALACSFLPFPLPIFHLDTRVFFTT